jgi:vitamin B12 transporter
VPMLFTGFPFGIANIPVNLVERIEVYRGVVPIRFGADALGGAINVVTDQSYETHLGASYQIGSFGTHRVTLGGRYRHEPTGLVAGASAYVDVAENNYKMYERPIPRDDGSAEYRTLPRFHDAYRGYGGNVEVGVVERKWARKLTVQGFFGTYDKQLQHNWVMTIPYGEVKYGEKIYGATARYEVNVTPNVEVGLVFNYSFDRFDWNDLATHRYRWTGEQGLRIGRDIAPGVPARGEITGVAIDRSLYTHALYGRADVAWTFIPGHIARLSVTPQAILQKGDDHVPDRVDLLGLHQQVKQVVSGVEYELNAFDGRLSNIVFGKMYYQDVFAELLNDFVGMKVKRDIRRDDAYYGGGDGVRYRFTDWLLGKLSYEYATRLPRGVELFGDGVLVGSNVDLKPERSHNVNLGPRLELRKTPAGDFTVDVNGFLRETKDLIVFLASVQDAPYQNILDVRSRGIEGAASWEAPGRYVGLDLSCTYQDIRNSSTTGVFAATNGRRMPNRPWLFGSAGIRGRFAKLMLPGDALEPYLASRYVHGFDRGWALGNPEFKLEMPAQLSHSAGVTYSLTGARGQVAATFAIDDLSDEPLFDVYGVQRPGRSFGFKLSGQI